MSISDLHTSLEKHKKVIKEIKQLLDSYKDVFIFQLQPVSTFVAKLNIILKEFDHEDSILKSSK